MTHLTATEYAPPGFDRIRVLHVDDQPDFVGMAGELLEQERDRIEVVTETSVSEGLDRLATEQFDCVVSDYEMPGLNGLDFLKQLRDNYPDLPFILFTGKGSEEIASEAISAGVTEYLQKEAGTDQYTILANRIENAVHQYRSQRAVEATEQKLLQLAENTDDILFLFDGDWEELLFINTAYEDIWDGSIDDLRENPQVFLERIHPEDRSKAKASLKRLQNGEPDVVEYRVQAEDDEYRWVRGESNPIFDDTGNVSRITGFVRDITDRKTREQELQAQVAAMEAATDGLAILNENNEFVYMNEMHADIYGFDDSERLLGESWRVCYDDTEIARFEDDILPVLCEQGQWQGDMTVTTSGGQIIHQELTLTQLDDGRVVCGVRDITGQKARERELERYKLLTNEVTDNISIVSEDGTIKYENPAIERILGYEPSELEGENAFEYMHPENRDDVIERFSMLVTNETQETDRIQYRMRHADGSWRWLESEAGSHTDTELDGYVITSRDITERKERERELEQYAAIVKSMGDTAFIVDSDWRLTFANETALEYADTSFADISDMPIMDITREMAATTNDIDRFETALEDAFADDDSAGTAQVVDVELDLPAGAITAEFQITPVRIDDCTKVVVTGRDITKRKHREDALRSLHEVTREFMEASDQQTVATRAIQAASSVLDQPMSGIWLYDEASDTLTPEAISDQAWDIVNEVPAFNPGEGLAWTVFETGEVDVYKDLHEEPDRYNPQTSIRSEILLPLGDYGLMAFGQADVDAFDDIDVALARVLANTVEAALARADRETQLRTQHEELQRQNKRLDEFANLVSHDLRNPLSVAQGNLELVAEECDSEHIDAVGRAHTRMERLIDDILTLAREGQTATNIESVRLASVINRCWETVETPDAAVVIETEQTIHADQSRLQQLLENLIRNAVEHGGDTVTITIGDLSDGFYVEDDGTGIPDDAQADIFEVGYSTATDGTGFGLSIVKQIADTHEWELTVTDSSDGGARFEFRNVRIE